MDLGIDLETEILVRLPLKSLMCFRCVQRSWNVLIQTPTFLKRRHMNMSDSPSLIILYETKPYVTLLSYDNLICFKSLFSNNVLHPIRIESYGSCNGVFCLKGFCWSHMSCLEELIMWNPTTREVHHIPPTPCLNNESFFYGFGADDPNSINFKVVKLHSEYFYDRRGHYDVLSAEDYNLSTKLWTPTQPPPPYTVFKRHRPARYNTLVNGVYHWITDYSYYYHNDDAANILCFDFCRNKFHQLTGPTFSYEDREFQWDDVAEIKGSLAYVVQRHFSAPVVLKIWVMDKSGWKKKYNIGPIMSMFRMFGLWKNGDQLLGAKVGEPLKSYDHEGNSLCQFQFDVDWNTNFCIHEYVPSIAPLSN